MKVAKYYLVLFALMALATGLAYIFIPLQMTAPMEFGALTAPALADIRANYGGFQAGLGIFLLYCANTARIKLGLLAVLLIMTCVPLGRVYGFLVDGGATQTLLGVLAMEVIFFVLTLVFYLRTPNDVAR
ncbi:MAG: hypothetical protein JWM78_3781 [Verrucomicrobiaceae bacterium]|nr:hypothetical protein [Verrucomicrobiaceae bacterium]